MVVDELAEAEALLEEVASWSEGELEELPQFYREAADRYRELANQGDAEST